MTTSSLLDAIDWQTEGDACVDLLRKLIRIPTVNPPGDEREAAELVAAFLSDSGVEPTVVEASPKRASVVARHRGSGELEPILLNAHLDVVEADASTWSHPPFSGDVAGGFIWGRGAIDMKNMVAMSACVLRLLSRHRVKLARDVIFAAVADEETGSLLGAHHLVSEHPELVRAEYALGEVGGFSQHLMGRVFYPIQVAEKGQVWVKARFCGEAGHGSIPREDNALVRAAEAIARVGRTRMPFHATEVVRRFLRELSRHLPAPARYVLPGLGQPGLSRWLLDHAIADVAVRRTFATYLSNTASPTVMRAGSKTNVIPATATFEIDGRTLPGQSEADFLRELRELVGKDAMLDVVARQEPLVTEVDTPMYRCLAEVLRRHDPSGIPLPSLTPGFTDAKAYARLGTKYYGFVPLKIAAEDEIAFSAIYHGKDERIPEAGLRWGLVTLFDAVVTFAGDGRV